MQMVYQKRFDMQMVFGYANSFPTTSRRQPFCGRQFFWQSRTFTRSPTHKL